MSIPAWRDVRADVDSMIRHFEGAEGLFERLGPNADGWDYYSTMALLHAMQSGYTSAEAALLRILDILDEDRPFGPDWYQTLIQRFEKPVEGDLARPALLSTELASALKIARSFRHRAMHVYDDFDIRLFPPALTAAQIMLRLLPSEIDAFQRAVDS